MKVFASLRFSAAIIALALFAPVAFAEDGWTEPVPVMNRAKIALTYRARIMGDYIVVEANHSPGWHTYAMDNTLRARKASREENPESELPTTIAVSGGAKVTGPWRQTQPVDKSQPEIHWYTWAFEGTARFAAPIERTGDGDIVVTIGAQSCDASSCTMVKDLRLVVPASSGEGANASALMEGLVPVAHENGTPGAG